MYTETTIDLSKMATYIELAIAKRENNGNGEDSNRTKL